VLLCIYPQLHFFHSLPQEEELLHLTLILAVETQEVLLRHFLMGDGLVAEVKGLGEIGLVELVEVALDSELILQRLDGELEMLQGEKQELRLQSVDAVVRLLRRAMECEGRFHCPIAQEEHKTSAEV